MLNNYKQAHTLKSNFQLVLKLLCQKFTLNCFKTNETSSRAQYKQKASIFLSVVNGKLSAVSLFQVLLLLGNFKTILQDSRSKLMK